MPSFPFLKLPEIVRERVVIRMEFSDFLIFSFISKRAKKLAIRAHKSLDSVTWNLPPENRFNCSIQFSPGVTIFMENSLEDSRRTEKIEECKIDGKVVRMYRKESWMWHFETEDSYQLMDQISAHILQIFNCDNFNLTTNTLDVSDSLFVFKYTRTFDLFYLLSSSSHQEEVAKLKFVLEDLEIKKELCVKPIFRGFRWEVPLRMDVLIVYQARWMSGNAFLNLECKEVRLSDHMLEEGILNQFIKKWLAGDLPNFEFCHLGKVQVGFPLQSGGRILRDLETTPSDPELRRVEGLSEALIRHGKGIRRRDGVIATIFISGMTFAMKVWK